MIYVKRRPDPVVPRGRIGYTPPAPRRLRAAPLAAIASGELARPSAAPPPESPSLEADDDPTSTTSPCRAPAGAPRRSFERTRARSVGVRRNRHSGRRTGERVAGADARGQPRGFRRAIARSGQLLQPCDDRTKDCERGTVRPRRADDGAPDPAIRNPGPDHAAGCIEKRGRSGQRPGPRPWIADRRLVAGGREDTGIPEARPDPGAPRGAQCSCWIPASSQPD